jgi:hypothetical protein
MRFVNEYSQTENHAVEVALLASHDPRKTHVFKHSAQAALAGPQTARSQGFRSHDQGTMPGCTIEGGREDKVGDPGQIRDWMRGVSKESSPAEQNTMGLAFVPFRLEIKQAPQYACFPLNVMFGSTKLADGK